jgi:acetyl-CoA synthetase
MKTDIQERLESGIRSNISLESLRILASVGEPIDQQTWQWLYRVIGRERCPVMDTWWQTETGGALICPLLKVGAQKAGCASKPFFGIQPVIIGGGGEAAPPGEKGKLCIKDSWPGQTVGILGDAKYFNEAYFSGGIYSSGDGAKLDPDGDYWILGRIDDVLNVSGHRLDSTELEQAALSYESISDVCVVGVPHETKGQGICVFAVKKSGIEADDAAIAADIKNHIRKTVGPIATPDQIWLVADLPKTRSGKIVRRLLRKIASGCDLDGEDISIVANRSCLDDVTIGCKAVAV